MKKIIILTLSLLMMIGCSSEGKVEPVIESRNKPIENSIPAKENLSSEKISNKIKIINQQGETIEERFTVPEGYERISAAAGSFEEYLRILPLRPHGSKVLYYDGREKENYNTYEAVVEVEIGHRDLHQCADAIMLLKAEYMYRKGEYDQIHFNFVNGFRADYSKWRQGYRIKVSDNRASWVKSTSPIDSYESFRKYMDMIFAYAGTLSLEKEMKSVDKADMKIGDVFIKGDSPGHAVLVVDMAINKSTGEKLFILAQSYMPAQQTQILCNNVDENMSPWYSLNYTGELHTPQWTFSENSLRRFDY